MIVDNIFNDNKKITAIIQARMESTRLPGKVLKSICGVPILKHIVNRVSMSEMVDSIIVATSQNQADDVIEEFCVNNKILYFRGSQENVLQRFVDCANKYKSDIIIRLTGDNALIDSEIIDSGIKEFQCEGKVDYLYYKEGLPIGMAIEIFKYSALARAYKEAKDSECLEHVTPYLYKNPDKFIVKRSCCNNNDYSNLRWTIDTRSDFILVSNIYNVLYQQYGDKFHYNDIIKEYKKHKEWYRINDEINQVKIYYQGEKK